ncbi:DUF5518 domain-containing protein [Halopiger xanaduensis]|uniref:DUF5518 domain-containing protein n=1 Tax=Halopiger xanaduensis (strain DSM 18323 / JCM 14033 / SH-6) TaxID=797210 RepID=F8D354_HALXS|nr:DUF5518 domain-containing protein [Halopiger xanaduensis]AEH37345.1 hypothetical protein Halxa_2728 [Halopiger xanaduensis SH-6]
MPSDTAGTPPTIETYPDKDDSSPGWNTSVNALVGGVVGIVLSFIPGSAFVGGALAGYLEGGDGGDGLRVGALAGLVMLVPMVLFWLFAMTMVLGAGMPGMPGTMGGFVFAVLAFLVLFTLGLSVVGAVVGGVLADEL